MVRELQDVAAIGGVPVLSAAHGRSAARERPRRREDVAVDVVCVGPIIARALRLLLRDFRERLAE